MVARPKMPEKSVIMETKRILKISNDYSVYQLFSNPDLYFAIHKTERLKIDKARLDFPERNFPDSLIVQGFRLGKDEIKDESTEIWDIIDHKPQDLKINDLYPVAIELVPPKY